MRGGASTRPSPIEMLAAVPLFRGCSKDELKRLDRAATQVDYEAGDVMCQEGTTGRELILLMSGHAEVETGGSAVATVGAGEFVGEMSLLDGGPRTATVTAVEPVRALVLPTREFWQVLDDVPPLAHKLLVALAQRLRRTDLLAYHA